MNPLFSDPGGRWFTIPAHRPFVDDLAAGLHAALAPGGPEALAEAVVLVPTRRGARALADGFVRAAGGGAVLLPQIRAIGDLEEGEPPFEPGNLALELAPAISPLRRRFELARLVAAHEAERGVSLDATAALAHGDALGELLDSLHIEECFDPDAVDALVEGDLARHWERSARFLAVATRAWPRRLEELGLIDPSRRRVELLRLLAAQWEANPPTTPLIAAGSTGAAPSMVAVLGAVARAPQGCVVLPGLDPELADEAWDLVDEQHPQAAMRRLLRAHGVPRGSVRPWPVAEDRAEAERGKARRRVVNEALRPAAATADWLRQIDILRDVAGRSAPDPIAAGLEGLSMVAARNEEEAATVAALLLRETLEQPGKTCALVTPDLALARRVSARLERWGVEADSSAGVPLAQFPVGQLIALVTRLAVDPLDPTALLAVAKHPLTRTGPDPDAFEAARRAMERHGLRGVRARSRDALLARLDGRPEARALAETLVTAGERLAAAFTEPVPVDRAAEALTVALESLAAARWLWSGSAGEAAAALLAGLIAEASGAPTITASGFAELIGSLLQGETVRSAGAHPRLRILGLIEARLVRSDRLVLAGLEEGVWPRPAPTDPFLSRPMRKALGLPSPERRVGQAAHDFAQAACAPEVVLLTTERRGGQPAVPSRWLWRLETLAKGAGVPIPRRDDALAWARALDAPLSPAPPELRPAERPMPRPKLSARPRELPVTRIETWVRDPYAVYARQILGLKALDPPDQPIDARIRGTAVHAAFERLALEHAELPQDVAAAFEALLHEELEKAGFDTARMARERALATNLARWVAGFERERRQGAALVIEQQGRLTFEGPAGDFVVTAKADRIELRHGYADVLDFKTGLPPSARQVESGFSPQLTLTAAILHAGGFGDCGAVEPGDLVYVRVTGRREPAKVEVRGARGESLELAVKALEGLKRRVAMFDREETPYASWSAPQFLKDRAGDYDHLARLYEWGVAGGEGDAEGVEA
jgi:ATP-dependent helicase/nuclease subunit B